MQKPFNCCKFCAHYLMGVDGRLKKCHGMNGPCARNYVLGPSYCSVENTNNCNGTSNCFVQAGGDGDAKAEQLL